MRIQNLTSVACCVLSVVLLVAAMLGGVESARGSVDLEIRNLILADGEAPAVGSFRYDSTT